jgi:hypothetical protein
MSTGGGMPSRGGSGKIDVCCIFMQCICDTHKPFNNIPFEVISGIIFSSDQPAMSLLLNTEPTQRANVRLGNIFNCLAYNWMIKDE